MASSTVYAIVEGGRWVIERSWPACAWAIGRPGARIRSFASADAAGEWAEDELRRARPRPHLELTPTAIIVGPRPAHGPDECVAALAVSAAPQMVGVGAVVTCGHHRWRGHRWLRASASAALAELEAAALALEAASTLGGGCTSMRLLGCSAALVSCLQRAVEAANTEDEATDAEAPDDGSGSSGGGALVARVATLVTSLPARLTPCERPTDEATYALLAEAHAEALKARVGRRSGSELLPPQPRPRALLVPPPSLLVPPPPGVDRPASTAAARAAGPEEVEAKAADRLLMPPPPPRVQPAPPSSHAPPSLAPPPPLRQLQEHHSNQQRSPTSAAAARASLHPKRSAPPSSDAPPSPQRRRHGAGTIPADVTAQASSWAGTIPANATAPAASTTAPAATWTARAATDVPVTALEPTATVAPTTAPATLHAAAYSPTTGATDGTAGWSCTQCTFWHGGSQRTFLTCAMCGLQRPKGKRTLKRAGTFESMHSGGYDGTAAAGASSSAAAAAAAAAAVAATAAAAAAAALSPKREARAAAAQLHDAARAPSDAAAERELLPYEEMELLSQMRYERQLEHQMSRQPPKTTPTPSPPSPPSPRLVPAAATAAAPAAAGRDSCVEARRSGRMARGARAGAPLGALIAC